MSSEPAHITRNGVKPPTNALFSSLRDRWLKAGEGRTSKQLATILGVPSQNVSQWATGSDERNCPHWVLMKMCQDLGLALLATPTGWQIVQQPQSFQ